MGGHSQTTNKHKGGNNEWGLKTKHQDGRIPLGAIRVEGGDKTTHMTRSKTWRSGQRLSLLGLRTGRGGELELEGP